MNPILFKNAKIYTLSNARVLNWMVVCDGKIITMGANDEEPPAFNYSQTIDLENKTVLPAFGDAHTHSLLSARLFFEADLSSADSLSNALEILKEFAADFKNERWIVGRGFNKNKWTDKPHRRHLDFLFPANPVYLESQDCHSAWVNSKALKLAGLTSSSADPFGGILERDDNGSLTGLLYDKAMRLVKKIIPETDESLTEKGISKMIRKLLSYGVATVHTMEGSESFGFWQKYRQKFPHQMRLVFYFPQEELEDLLKVGVRSGFGNEWLKIGGIKFFTDGSLGSQTAELLQPYENKPEYFGVSVIDEKELRARVQLAERNGLATAIHAIGDGAVKKALAALKSSEPWRKRFNIISRIEHAQLVPDFLLPLFNQYNLTASVQPVHIADDVKIAERFWGDRCKFAYPFRSLISNGTKIAFGSDMPVADPDPIKGIFSAVNRRYQFSLTEPVWHPEQALTVNQAVEACTKGVARAANQTDIAGTLEAGKNADFVVLNADIFNASPDELLEIKVEKTALAGCIVYQRT
ncbi:MAG: amidohydrolase family protein [Calditrichaeota bacterium]|nr:amidohydrolase family protein [Calditrichota bacterium]